jgi:hypothetical protein
MPAMILYLDTILKALNEYFEAGSYYTQRGAEGPGF